MTLFNFRLDKSSRSQSFDEEAVNRRQLPNVPKKPQRQKQQTDSNNREPTPDYDSSGDKDSKSPLATSPVKKCDNNENSDQNASKQTLDNANANANNQAKGKD